MPEHSAGSKTTATRRTVLRAAVHTAWAVPAIQIAGAAPAFAGSTQTPLTLTSATYAAQGVNYTLSATASYPGDQAPENFVLTFTFPDAPGKQTDITVATGPDDDTDWEVVTALGNLSFSVVRKTPIQVSPVNVSLTVQVKPKKRSPGPITVIASASNMLQHSKVATPA